MAGNLSNVRHFPCPECRAPVNIRGIGNTPVVACPGCGSIIDSADPGLRVIQKFQREALYSELKLGSRCTFRDVKYEVLGVIARSDATNEFTWKEYLLMNPYRGFAWLVESNGHWSLVAGVKDGPHDVESTGVQYRGRWYKHFLTDNPRVASVLGEFYWELKRGDRTSTDDYIAPPYFLSREVADDEVSWSHGEYLTVDEVEAAFTRRPDLGSPSSVAMNQPNPWAGRLSHSFIISILFTVVLGVIHAAVGHRVTRLRQNFTMALTAEARESKPFTVEPFTVTNGPTNLGIDLAAPVNNTWLEFDLELVETATGARQETSAEVSFYSGADSDGAWTEGRTTEQYYFTDVSSGRYQLMGSIKAGDQRVAVPVLISIREGITTTENFVLALVFLYAVPFVCLLGIGFFERARWSQSSYAGGE